MHLLIIFAIFIGQALHSTVVTLDSIETMSKNSELIVHAGVAKTETRYDESGRIITLITLEILDDLKGAQHKRHITVYQVGGELDGKVFHVAGAHRYQLGEEIFLFGLPLPQDDKIVSYGVGVGKFNVKKDSTGERIVEELHDLTIATLQQNRLHFTEPSPRVFTSVKQFKDRIVAALKPHSPHHSLLIKPVSEDLMWHAR